MASANIFGGLADGALNGLAAVLLLLLNGRIARKFGVFSPADSAIDDLQCGMNPIMLTH